MDVIGHDDMDVGHDEREMVRDGPPAYVRGLPERRKAHLALANLAEGMAEAAV